MNPSLLNSMIRSLISYCTTNKKRQEEFRQTTNYAREEYVVLRVVEIGDTASLLLRTVVAHHN